MNFKLGPVGIYLNPLAIALFSSGYVGLLTGWLLHAFHLSLGSKLALVAIPVMLVVTKQPGKTEPYGTFQRSLNDVPGKETTTEWLNMGYWSSGSTFPEACRALALKVALPTCIESGHVLDVGFGSGDSLLLQLEDPDIPRPKSLTGITSMAAQYQHAWSRVQGSHAYSSQIPVTLYQGDAVLREGASNDQEMHPLHPQFGQAGITFFDSILALDCAYHFSTRELFLQQCIAKLRPGSGRIALADICFEPGLGTIARNSASLWARALSVPSENLVTIAHYQAQLQSLGFADVQIEDITEHVFPGFISFLSSRGFLWRLFARMMNLWWRAGGRFVLVTAAAPRLVD